MPSFTWVLRISTQILCLYCKCLTHRIISALSFFLFSFLFYCCLFEPGPQSRCNSVAYVGFDLMGSFLPQHSNAGIRIWTAIQWFYISSVCLILVCPTGQNLELLCSVDIHLPVISANNIISHTIHKMWLLNIDCDKTRRPRGSWHPWLLSCTVLICHHKVLGTLLWKSTQNQITSRHLLSRSLSWVLD